MPLYTFRCLKCGHLVEGEYEFSEEHATHHNDPRVSTVLLYETKLLDSGETNGMRWESGTFGHRRCDGELQRIYDVPNIIYRGSGFYTTDKVLYDPIKPEDEDD